jgi:hypothetical protein
MIGLRFILLIESLWLFLFTFLNLLICISLSSLRCGEHCWLLLEKNRRRIISHHWCCLLMEFIDFLFVHVTTVLTLKSTSTSRTVISAGTVCLTRTCLGWRTGTRLGLDCFGGHINDIVTLRPGVLAFKYRQLKLIKSDLFLVLDC